jgi:hypothetical protein
LGWGLVVTLAVFGSQVGAKPKPDSCDEDKRKVVDAYATFSNVADFGLDGHVWALDSGTQSIEIWQIGTNAYCLKRRDLGGFTSFAGASPAGTGTIDAGVTGTFDGTVFLRIYGTFDPKVPTTGFIGHFDAQCDQEGNCTGAALRSSVLYFSRTNFVDFGAFHFVAVADDESCGEWTQTPTASSGDIVC